MLPAAIRAVPVAVDLSVRLPLVVSVPAVGTSVLEGINNKIKVLKRMAYGFRDDDYFFLKIRAAFPGNT